MLRLRLVRVMVIRWREGLGRGDRCLMLECCTWENLEENLHAFVLWIDWMEVE